MRELLRQTIDLLKKRVQHNLNIIHKNEKSVREILQEPVSSERSERLDEKFGINKKMLEENNDSIKIQLSIIRFLDNYSKQLEEYIEEHEFNADEISNNIKETIEPESKGNQNFEINEINRDDYFDLTIHKSIDYNEQHPYFEDEDFYKELMAYFTNIEDYEMCSKLIASHKKDDAFLN